MMMVWMKKTATRHDATDDVYQFCFLFFLLDVHFFSHLWQEKNNRVFLPRFDPVFGMAL